ncbi:MAG TPA: STAS domain-containing protein [Solirubrobacteraceae bacterium]|nr:STAS domain-containing protein [Solirubrobacteraceae bacterium]
MKATATGDPVPPDGALFVVDSEYTGRCARLALHGELDVATVSVLDEELRRAWAQTDIRRMELDLRGVTFMGSAGVAALLGANARARDRGCALTLVRGTDRIHRIFELTGIADQFAYRSQSARPDARSSSLRIVT